MFVGTEIYEIEKQYNEWRNNNCKISHIIERVFAVRKYYYLAIFYAERI